MNRFGLACMVALFLALVSVLASSAGTRSVEGAGERSLACSCSANASPAIRQ